MIYIHAYEYIHTFLPDLRWKNKGGKVILCDKKTKKKKTLPILMYNSGEPMCFFLFMIHIRTRPLFFVDKHNN